MSARLDTVLADPVVAHDGARPVEQGEATVSCWRHAGQRRGGGCVGVAALRDEGNYIGPTINRTAPIRDLAYDGVRPL